MTQPQESSPHGLHDGGTGPVSLFDELRAARAELHEAIEQIQLIPGYERFLAPVEMDEISAAADHPLVYLTASDDAGVALVVRGDRVDSVPLPALRTAPLREWAERHREHFPTAGSRGAAQRGGWDRHLADLRDRLWEAVAEPLLADLSGVPHASLVPCGLVGLLPVHVAGYRDSTRPTGFRYLIDDLSIGYVPNARALAASRRRAASTPTGRLLTVADPQASAPADRLPYARWEAQVAAATFPGPVTQLCGPDATVERVRADLPTAWLAHFGCHGNAEPTDPLRSALRLAGDGRLHLSDIMPMRLTLRLAVLSACSAFVPGRDLPDEVISLPTGLVQAGAAGVLAPMWPVDDHTTALLMTEFYRRWRIECPQSPATALAGAQRWLRDATVAEVEQQWVRALDAHEAWLPEEAAEALLPHLFRSGSGDSRPWSSPAVWAAFAFTGA